ncbi:MAG: hypothetical protein NVSMB1_22560 [Polyangiales bacterium]
MALACSAFVIAFAPASVRAQSANLPQLAEDPPTRRPVVSTAVFGGYGHQFVGLPAYRYGLGLRAGVSVSRIYVGLQFTGNAGTRERATGIGSDYDSAFYALRSGPEVGLDVTAGPYLVRPFVGLGLFWAIGHSTVRGATVSDQRSYFFVEPGLTALYRYRGFFGGLEARFTLVPAQSPLFSALNGFLVAGLNLVPWGR